MDDTGQATLRRARLQQADGVLVGLAGMDNQRQAALARCLDMGFEDGLLLLPVALVVIVIEPRFADPDHFRMPGQGDQPGDIDSRLETFADWQEENKTGVIYYLKDGRVRGAMMCNVWNQVDAARALIRKNEPANPESLRGAIR